MRSLALAAGLSVVAGLLPAGFTTYFLSEVTIALNSARRSLQNRPLAPVQCPTGWEEIPDAKGRIVVSVIDPTIGGITVGALPRLLQYMKCRT